jgi:metal-responsive CopG/Arc/MetJ family transcriptional regulator
MKAVQVVFDEETLRIADRAARQAKVNRSELIREAVRLYAARKHEIELEAAHRRGYERTPVRAGEFDALTKGQAWPEK